MKNNGKIVVSKKKTSTGKTMLKAVAIMAAVNGGIKLYSMYSSKKSNQVDLVKGEYNYSLMMNGKQIKFENEAVRKITLSTRMSGIDLNLSNINDLDGLKIECRGWMSGICIRVPKDVAVKVELKTRLGEVSKTVPDYLDESLPTIHISGKVYLSGINIRLIEE